MVNNLGVTVMLNMLFGAQHDSAVVFQKNIGKKIKALQLDGETSVLQFEFEDGSKMNIRDDGQSCCEDRYMRTDDNLQEYVGATLLDAEIKPAANLNKEREYDNDHEIEFLDIKTDKGVFTMTSHNEHNGYYGGFSIICEDVK